MSTRILFYTFIGIAIVVIVIGSMVYASMLESNEAQAYCEYNRNVVDGLELSPESCRHYYKQTNHLFWFI